MDSEVYTGAGPGGKLIRQEGWEFPELQQGVWGAVWGQAEKLAHLQVRETQGYFCLLTSHPAATQRWTENQGIDLCLSIGRG